MSTAISPVVHQRALRLVAGDSRFSTITFYQGTPVRPFSVGSAGDWIVAAEGVQPIHLYLAFDGFSLLVATSCEQATATVFGQALDRSWTTLPEWAELRFGDAVLLLTPEEAPSWTPEKLPSTNATQVLHYPALRGQRTGTAVWSLADLGVCPPEPSATSQSPTATVFDQGALRALAERIAWAQEQATAASPGPPADPTSEADMHAAAGAPAVAPTEPEPSTPEPPACQPPVLARRADLHERWRNAPLARRATVVLLPFAALAAISLAHTLLSEESEPSEPAAAKHSAAAQRAVDRSVARAPIGTASAKTPGVANTKTLPAPPRGASSAILADERASLKPAPKPTATEQSAIQAASEGKLPEAAALYSGLAVGEKAQVFTLAARLAQEGAVRRP